MNKVPHAAVSRGPRPQLAGNQRPGHGDTCVGAAVAGQQARAATEQRDSNVLLSASVSGGEARLGSRARNSQQTEGSQS